ncbi:MAG: LuxR C-terminal-related transcriptional regulator [Sphingobium sp.]
MLDRDEEGLGLSAMADALSGVESRQAAFDCLSGFVRALGFADLILTIESNAMVVKWSEMRWSTLDPARLGALDAIGFDGHDPIRRFARRSLDPFVWTTGEWPGVSSGPGRGIMNDLRKASIHAGMTAAIWGRAGRVAVIDAFGAPDHVLSLTRWTREALHLATAMTFRAIERVSLVRGGAALTRREIEIIDLASHGLSTRAIARRLEIVEPTVKFHLKSVRTKLNARNTSEAIGRFAALDLSMAMLDGGERGQKRVVASEVSRSLHPT